MLISWRTTMFPYCWRWLAWHPRYAPTLSWRTVRLDTIFWAVRRTGGLMVNVVIVIVHHVIMMILWAYSIAIWIWWPLQIYQTRTGFYVKLCIPRGGSFIMLLWWKERPNHYYKISLYKYKTRTMKYKPWIKCLHTICLSIKLVLGVCVRTPLIRRSAWLGPGALRICWDLWLLFPTSISSVPKLIGDLGYWDSLGQLPLLLFCTSLQMQV